MTEGQRTQITEYNTPVAPTQSMQKHTKFTKLSSPTYVTTAKDLDSFNNCATVTLSDFRNVCTQ